MNSGNVGEDTTVSDLSQISGPGARQINEALNSSPRAKDFHRKAEMLLLSKSEEYLAKVGIAAVAIADQRNGATVDVPDVESAIASLENVASETRAALAKVAKTSTLFGLGGFSAGIGATAIVATLLTQELTRRSWWIIGVAGFLLLLGIVLNLWAFRRTGLLRRKERTKPAQAEAYTQQADAFEQDANFDGFQNGAQPLGAT
jgi:hypothetical protein